MIPDDKDPRSLLKRCFQRCVKSPWQKISDKHSDLPDPFWVRRGYQILLVVITILGLGITIPLAAIIIVYGVVYYSIGGVLSVMRLLKIVD